MKKELVTKIEKWFGVISLIVLVLLLYWHIGVADEIQMARTYFTILFVILAVDSLLKILKK